MLHLRAPCVSEKCSVQCFMLHYEVGNDLTKPTGNRFNNNSFIINSAGEFVELSLTVRFFQYSMNSSFWDKLAATWINGLFDLKEK